jgi:hypothetical protein
LLIITKSNTITFDAGGVKFIAMDYFSYSKGARLDGLSFSVLLFFALRAAKQWYTKV